MIFADIDHHYAKCSDRFTSLCIKWLKISSCRLGSTPHLYIYYYSVFHLNSTCRMWYVTDSLCIFYMILYFESYVWLCIDCGGWLCWLVINNVNRFSNPWKRDITVKSMFTSMVSQTGLHHTHPVKCLRYNNLFTWDDQITYEGAGKLLAEQVDLCNTTLGAHLKSSSTFEEIVAAYLARCIWTVHT